MGGGGVSKCNWAAEFPHLTWLGLRPNLEGVLPAPAVGYLQPVASCSRATIGHGSHRALPPQTTRRFGAHTSGEQQPMIRTSINHPRSDPLTIHSIQTMIQFSPLDDAVRQDTMRQDTTRCSWWSRERSKELHLKFVLLLT